MDTRRAARIYVVLTMVFLGGFWLYLGVWSLFWPKSFAEWVEFAYHEHFLHDIGAFQIGIGFGLLLAVLWRDAISVGLAAFIVTNTIHAIIHEVDSDIGGRSTDFLSLGSLSLVAALALVLRLQQQGLVVGHVRQATTASLAPFTEQKTALLTTYKRDGTPVDTPLSVAVEGDLAFIRSYEKAWKTRRIANNPAVKLAPCTQRGKPLGEAIEATAKRLDGAESKHAARLLRAKHPLLHVVLVPLMHRVFRSKTGKTVHFVLTPAVHPEIAPEREVTTSGR